MGFASSFFNVVSVCRVSRRRYNFSSAPRARDSAHFRQTRSLSHSARMRHSTVEFRGLPAPPRPPPSLRPLVRSSVRPSLSPSPSVIRRSTLAVAVATVARSSRIVAARRRPSPPTPPRPPPSGSPLSAKSAEGGRKGRPRPSECPQADFAIGEQRNRESVSDRCSFKECASLHYLVKRAFSCGRMTTTLQTQKC